MKVSIVVPIYKIELSQKELESINRTRKILATYDIHFILPFRFKKIPFSFISKNADFVHYVDDYFLSGITGYNRLLLNLEFYKLFKEYEYILICQLDVYVLKDDLAYWVNKKFSFVGAPIIDLKDKNQHLKLGNNGGFSLRNVSDSISVLLSLNWRYCDLTSLLKSENSYLMKIYRLIVNGLIFNYKWSPLAPILNEDIFWSVIVPNKFSFFKIPELGDSVKFAFDANPKYFFELNQKQLPMAIHAWCKYDLMFVESLISTIE